MAQSFIAFVITSSQFKRSHHHTITIHKNEFSLEVWMMECGNEFGNKHCLSAFRENVFSSTKTLLRKAWNVPEMCMKRAREEHKTCM